MARHEDLRGDQGEDAAVRWLLRRGWRVLARNWHGGGGELDVVAERRGVLAVCEVKARGDALALEDPVRAAQRDRLRRAAIAFLARHPALAGHEVRFDVLAVRRGRVGLRVRRVAGAFAADDPVAGARLGYGSKSRSSR